MPASTTIMDNRQLTPSEAAELFRAEYVLWEQDLAERRYWELYTIINSTTHRLRPEYHDMRTARRVAAAVNLLEIVHGRALRWNKDELRMLFDSGRKNRQPKNK